MKITYFSRMKAYRKDGRLSAILKLSLPAVEVSDGEENVFSEFNSFYTSLAEIYIENLESVNFSNIRTAKITVGFEDITEGYKVRRKNQIVIKRYIKIIDGEKARSAEYVDVYDTSLGVFVK